MPKLQLYPLHQVCEDCQLCGAGLCSGGEHHHLAILVTMCHVSPQVTQLDPADFILDYGELGNFSVAGFEMQLRRHVSHYLITYYLPSGD